MLPQILTPGSTKEIALKPVQKHYKNASSSSLSRFKSPASLTYLEDLDDDDDDEVFLTDPDDGSSGSPRLSLIGRGLFQEHLQAPDR